ncbi:MAG: CDP-alcohol phosphatidyltransferase family protein [Lachnospiraceae bacterium]|nr:CDP-alcohol phosphatidyltransferase family protein [Lachnospiraceae bacterium]
MLLGVYDYTVILTYFGLLTGYLGITLALHGDIGAAMFCLMGAGFCDMFDGKVASTKKNRTQKEKRFGIQIDSLSDLICFGVLPAVIVYKACEGSDPAFYISALYVLSALIRLAWFNVDEEERQDQTDGARAYYLGLPVTTSALILPLLLGIAHHLGIKLNVLAPVILFCMGLAFLIPFKLKKPQLAGKIGVLFCGGAELLILLAGIDV